MDSENRATSKLAGLAGARCFEGLRMAAEPDLNDAIAADALVDAASNRLHLGQFGHRLIVEDCDSGRGPATMCCDETFDHETLH